MFTRKSSIRSIILFLIAWLVFYVTTSQHTQAEMPKPIKAVQEWQREPKVPQGWLEVDRKKAKITNQENYDFFVLMTDGKNDLIVWFEKARNYWKMSVIESVSSEKHIEYGLDIKKAILTVEGNSILYGLEGTQAVSYFEWNQKEKLFIRFVP